jgi:hypothetical protein
LTRRRMTGHRNYSACRADFVQAVDSSRRSSSSSSTNLMEGTLPSYSRHTRRTAASSLKGRPEEEVIRRYLHSHGYKHAKR